MTNAHNRKCLKQHTLLSCICVGWEAIGVSLDHGQGPAGLRTGMGDGEDFLARSGVGRIQPPGPDVGLWTSFLTGHKGAVGGGAFSPGPAYGVLFLRPCFLLSSHIPPCNQERFLAPKDSVAHGVRLGPNHNLPKQGP